MKTLFVILLSLTSFSVLALDINACSRLLNNGLYKKYEYGGIDQPLTKATKKHGSSKGTSATSTEGTTALLDPKYWSNVSTSETQTTSSSGECNLFALNQIKESRELYIIQNRDELMVEVSKGQGEHLDVLATFSLCDKGATSNFKQSLQHETSELLKVKENFGRVIDSMVSSNEVLNKACHIYI